MGTLNSWDVTDANNNATPPDGWPENTMQYSEVNDTGRAVQGTVRRFWGDANGSLNAAGAANAYTLTLNETGYSAYFAGMWFACVIVATNTGASTINVNGIGAATITDRGGNALTGGELQAGGIYEFRYDGTNFQLMGTIVGSVSTDSAVLTNSNAPDLVDTDVALNVGATDPSAAQHVEVGPQQIQSKSDGTTAADLSINELGGNVQLGASGAGSSIIETDSTVGMILRSDDSGDPTVPNAVNIRMTLESADGNPYAIFGTPGVTTLDIISFMHGAQIQARGEDSGGALRVIWNGDPDGIFVTYHAGSSVTQTASAASGGLEVNNLATGGGFERVLTTSDLGGGVGVSGTPVNNQVAVWTNSNTIEGDANFTFSGGAAGTLSTPNITGDANELSLVGYDENDDGFVIQDGARITFEDQAFANPIYIRNEGIGGGSGTLAFVGNGDIVDIRGMNLRLENTAGSVGVTLSLLQSPTRFNVGDSMRVQGGLYLLERSAADTNVAGDGQLWVVTDTPNRLKFTDDSDQDYDVAMVGGYVNDNVFVNNSRNYNTAGNFAANNILQYDDGSNNTITLEDSTSTTNWPVYTSIQVLAPGSGVQTITEGSGTTLFDDSGTDLVGGCTVQNGIVTIYRGSSANYFIFGSGITP